MNRSLAGFRNQRQYASESQISYAGSSISSPRSSRRRSDSRFFLNQHFRSGQQLIKLVLPQKGIPTHVVQKRFGSS
jgi:hypothetical protein